MLKKISAGLVGAFAFAVVVTNNVMAAAVDYASTTGAIDDATSGLPEVLFGGSLKVIGIALGLWGLFWLVGKLRKMIK